MGDDGVDIARALRERRRALGLTRTRLAERTGIGTVDLARWERGEDLPQPGDVVVLAEAIGLELAETQRWLDTVTVDLTGAEVSAELVASDEAPSDPFVDRGAPPEAEPPLLTRIADRLARRDARRDGGDASVTPIRAPEPTPTRSAPSTTTRLVKVPRPASQLPSVFPEPAIAPYDPAVLVYSTSPLHPPTEAEQQMYLLRRVRTAAVLIGLGIALWWAVGSFWEGLGDVIELFRTPVIGG